MRGKFKCIAKDGTRGVSSTPLPTTRCGDSRWNHSEVALKVDAGGPIKNLHVLSAASPKALEYRDFFRSLQFREFDLILNNLRATMVHTSVSSPTSEDIEELLLIARYGELDELESFIEKFGTKPLIDARDEDGNTVLHMVCGNGHIGAADSTQRTRMLFQCSFTD